MLLNTKTAIIDLLTQLWSSESFTCAFDLPDYMRSFYKNLALLWAF